MFLSISLMFTGVFACFSCSITCTAGVGTFIVEFGALSRLTGDPVYEEVAMNAIYSLKRHMSNIGLYGNHIDVQTGRWTGWYWLFLNLFVCLFVCWFIKTHALRLFCFLKESTVGLELVLIPFMNI